MASRYTDRVQRTSFRAMHCSLARALDAVGEWWSPLVVRDLYLGLGRFDELQADLGISSKVLSLRLAALVAAGIVARTPYQSRPRRDAYVLTEKGRALVPALLALMAWGDRWASPDGRPPLVFRHEPCGRVVEAQVTCSHCGRELHASEVTPLRGPGGARAPGTKLIAELLARSPPGARRKRPGTVEVREPRGSRVPGPRRETRERR
jgi:DNA-binding HxlR family transcriptional regulator